MKIKGGAAKQAIAVTSTNRHIVDGAAKLAWLYDDITELNKIEAGAVLHAVLVDETYIARHGVQGGHVMRVVVVDDSDMVYEGSLIPVYPLNSLAPPPTFGLYVDADYIINQNDYVEFTVPPP